MPFHSKILSARTLWKQFRMNASRRDDYNTVIVILPDIIKSKFFNVLLKVCKNAFIEHHYSDVMMSAMAFPITAVSIVCSTVCSGADQRKHQSSATLAFVRGIHRWPVDSPHKGPVTRKMFPFDDVITIVIVRSLPRHGPLRLQSRRIVQYRISVRNST